MSKRTAELQELLEPSVVALGYELWGIEYLAQGKHSILRLYIDSENGITVDDCAAVSHQVSGVLDVEDPIPTEYDLEVSSPGLDRPLFTLDQFARYAGEQVQLKLLKAVNGKRKFNATIVAVAEASITLEVDQETSVDIAFADIDKAFVIPRFD